MSSFLLLGDDMSVQTGTGLAEVLASPDEPNKHLCNGLVTCKLQMVLQRVEVESCPL